MNMGNMETEDSERSRHTANFRQWVLSRTGPDYQLYESGTDPETIVIETDYCRGEVAFYPMDIIQLSVLNKITDSHVFYLHFQMHTQEHAQSLFEEMLETVQELTVRPPTKILLCCSSGLTTGFFAEKLNTYAAGMSIHYTFSAVSYSELYHVGNQYDLILLAPQISYIYKKAQEILQPKIVRIIPAKTFAAYDVQQLFSEIKNHLDPDAGVRQADTGSGVPLLLKRPVRTQHKVLAIALIREDQHKFRFASRLYDRDNSILFDEDIIKHHLSLSDLYDICDTAFARHPDIALVGIAMPGIINHGRVRLIGLGLNDTDVISILTEKYGRKFILDNDANSIAVGYYVAQDKYDSLSCFFQPFIGSSGGVGSIYKGQLIEGRCHVAGEVQYLPAFISNSSDKWKTPEGALDLAAQTITSITSILGPDAVVLSCRLIVQIDELLEEIGRYLPRQYIPEIVKVDNVREYMLTGQLILCSQTEPE